MVSRAASTVVFDVLGHRARGVEVLEVGHGALGLAQRLPRLHRRFLVAGDGELQAFEPPARDVAVGLGAGQRAARLRHRLIGATARLAGGRVGGGGLGQPRLEHVVGARRAIGPRGRLLEILLEFLQPVQLLEPQRGGRGRILRPGAEAVPAPEVAFDADEALAGLQVRLKARPVLAVDKPHLPHPADEHVRHGDVVGRAR